MLEITSNESVVTVYNISIYDSWSIDNDQLVVEISGKKYFCMSVHIQKDWNSDSPDWELDGLKYATGEASLVSVLKNGKAGNDYKTQIIYENSFNGIFTYMFDAYKQELAKTSFKQLVEAK